VAIDTMGSGIGPFPVHLDVLRDCAEALRLPGPVSSASSAAGGHG
jgi:hypothetical protein